MFNRLILGVTNTSCFLRLLISDVQLLKLLSWNKSKELVFKDVIYFWGNNSLQGIWDGVPEVIYAF